MRFCALTLIPYEILIIICILKAYADRKYKIYLKRTCLCQRKFLSLRVLIFMEGMNAAFLPPKKIKMYSTKVNHLIFFPFQLERHVAPNNKLMACMKIQSTFFFSVEIFFCQTNAFISV